MKKVWSQPTLDTLDVSMTMAGIGSKYIDFVGWDNGVPDFDVVDEPTPWPVPPDLLPS